MRKNKSIILFNVDEVIRIHDKVITCYGGRAGIRDKGLLESAINYPWLHIEFGSQKDQGIAHFAAIYLFHIIKNHPFVDGNKRTGLLASSEFLDVNGFEIVADLDALEELALDTAVSRITKKEITDFFKKNTKRRTRATKNK